MKIADYNQMMAYLTRPEPLPQPKPEELLDLQEQKRKDRLRKTMEDLDPVLMDESKEFIERNEMAIGGGVIEGEDLGTREGFKVPKDIPKNMVKFFKRPKEMQDLLNKYAKFLYKKPYIRLNAEEQGIVKGRAKRGFFTTKDSIREVSTKAEIEKYTKAFPGIDFDFKKHPRYGVPLRLPNGKINPEYTSAFNFRQRGYKKNLSKKSLPVAKQRDIVAKFNLPPGVKEWNFDVDRGGYLYGIPDTAGKNRNLGERIKNFNKNPVTYKVSADFSDPAGWMLLQMNRSYEDALAKGLEPEFEPIYDKINNKNRVVGFVDNKYGGGKSYFAGQKYIKKFDGTSMRAHPDYDNVRKFFNITEKARLKPNKVITDLLVRGGIGEDRLTLNSVLNYLINEKGVQPAKKAVVLHHKGGIGNPTRDLQIINALANNQVKGIENAMRKDPKNITPENIKKLKDFGVSVTIDGKTYGGGPKTALGGFRETEKFVEEKIKGFTQKDFTKLKTFLAGMSSRPQCKAKFFSSGGRVNFQDGSPNLDFCAKDGAKVLNSGNIPEGAAKKNFINFANKAMEIGKQSGRGLRTITKFGVLPEMVIIGADTLIRTGMGDTLNEAFLRASDIYRTDEAYEQADASEINRRMNSNDGELILNLRKFNNEKAKLSSLEQAKEADLALAGNDFAETNIGMTEDEIEKMYAPRLQEQENNVFNASISDAEERAGLRAETEFADKKGVDYKKSPVGAFLDYLGERPGFKQAVDLFATEARGEPDVSAQTLKNYLSGKIPQEEEKELRNIIDTGGARGVLDAMKKIESAQEVPEGAIREPNVFDEERKILFELAKTDPALAERLFGPNMTLSGDPIDSTDLQDEMNLDRGIYALGGRIGFKDGPKNPGRRTFIKGMGILAALPFVGKFIKPAAPIVQKLANTTTVMPDWFPKFVDNFLAKGVGKKIDADIMQYNVDELPGVTLTKVDDGRIKVEGKNAYGEPYEINYTPPGYEVVDETTGKAVKTPGEFEASDTRFRQTGPELDDVDVDYDTVKDIDDIVGGNSTELEGFAKGTGETKYTKGQKAVDEADARSQYSGQERADFDQGPEIDPTDYYYED